MNLQLNLLLESEIRSGSNVSRKFIVRIAAAAVPVIILSVLIPLHFAIRHVENNLNAAVKEKSQLEPVYDTVMELRDEMERYEHILREMEGWHKSRMDWYEVLTELQMIVPANVQLTRLMISERIEEQDGVPARKMLMMFKGMVVGKEAREDIQRFDRDMRENAVFSSIASDMEIRLLGASESPDEPDVRLFDGTCAFYPRKMGERRPRRVRR